MTANNFDKYFEEQVELCRAVLCNKAKEYATEDRLHNFHVAAGLEGCSAPAALAGMMAKHTVSVYDLCRSPEWDQFPLELWEEKINDSLNYLFLLNAMIREQYAENERLLRE